MKMMACDIERAPNAKEGTGGQEKVNWARVHYVSMRAIVTSFDTLHVACATCQGDAPPPPMSQIQL